MSKTSSMKELLEFQKKYKLGDVLGEGNFSVVRKCFTKAGDQSMYAVKVVKLKGNKEKKEDIKTMLQSEVAVMQKINNRNIIKCIDAFFGSDEIMVVLEGTANGDLYDYIINTQEADEGRARCVINDIANAVHYLHGMKIVHRDIKPENFLIFPLPNGEHVVKLCDFGLAVDARQTITEVCGSPSYVAPEVLRMENYGLPVDIWSCGVVFYILLCHFPPFYAENTRKLFQKIMKGNFDFPSPYWDDVSESAKDLISRMLVLNTDRRLQAEEMISHPWLQELRKTRGDKETIDSKSCPMSLRGIAIAVRCMQRFAEPVLKPTRERAILSASFIRGCDLEKQ